MSRITIQSPRRLRGSVAIPGDRFIAHCALVLNATARGTAQITNLPAGHDIDHLIACLQAFGAHIERQHDTTQITGSGLHGIREPVAHLECGSSETTLRLLCGLLCGLPLSAVLGGDLSDHSQHELVAPLQALGARIDCHDSHDGGCAPPLTIYGAPLHGGTCELHTPDPAIKAALLFSALGGDAPLKLTETVDTPDHAERLLAAMGIDIGIGLLSGAPAITLFPPLLLDAKGLRLPAALSFRVPGDPALAAFWWVAAAVHPDAELTTPGVCLNPTRLGVLDVLRAMGARIAIVNQRQEGNEPVGDVIISSSTLRGVAVDATVLPRMPHRAGELSALAVAAACADGDTIITYAPDMQPNDTQHMSALAHGLTMLGVQASLHAEGLHISGSSGTLRGAVLHSYGDHQLAMAWGVAALAASTETTITETDVQQTPCPAFWEQLALLKDDQ
jgi:3-phosphoshikimate 1-carboxyvinyltransferase